jgi:hypothetical protein
VKSVPALSTTQHAEGPQMPALPAGSCRATLRVASEATPGGSVRVQVVTSMVPCVDDAKHAMASKHPTAAAPSTPRLASGSPGPPMPPSYVGTDDAGNAEGTHAPCTHVCPAGHDAPGPASGSPPSPAGETTQR